MAKYGRRRLGLSAGVGFVALLGLMATIVSWPTEPAKGVAPNPHTVSGTVNGATTGEVVRLAIRSEGPDGLQIFVECSASSAVLVEAPVPPSTAMTYRFPLNFPEPGGFPGCSPTGSSSFAQVCIGDRSGHAATQVVLSTGNPYSPVTLTRQANKPCPSANWIAGRGLVQGFVFINGQAAPDNTLVTYATQGGCATDPAAGALTQTMQIPDPPNPTVSGALYSFEILFPATGFGGCNVITFYVNGQVAQVANANGPSDGTGTPAANPYTVASFPKKFGFTLVNLSIGSGFAPGGDTTPTPPGASSRPLVPLGELPIIVTTEKYLNDTKEVLASLVAKQSSADPAEKAKLDVHIAEKRADIAQTEKLLDDMRTVAARGLSTDVQRAFERQQDAAAAAEKARPATPDVRPVAGSGRLDDCSGPIGLTVLAENCWFRDVGLARPLAVYAGRTRDGRGALWVDRPLPDGSTSASLLFPPVASGRLRVTGATGNLLEITNDTGVKYTFDSTTDTFVGGR
jgi:hypothetical protein